MICRKMIAKRLLALQLQWRSSTENPGDHFDCSKGWAADKLALAQPADDDDRRDRQHRGRGKFRPEKSLRAGKGCNEGR